MNKHLEIKLETLREFQTKYPNSHIGGSVGLMIRGIDVGRDISLTDLDITTDKYEVTENTDYENRSDGNDFDYNVKKWFDSGYYVKIDIRISANEQYDIIAFNGHLYNVSKLQDILKFKRIYAKKGTIKHYQDLCYIAFGEHRPLSIASIFPIDDTETYDLPF